jgi:tetratricopeptide (TPR) repeat protein
LAALSGFFDPPWREPVDGLNIAAQALVLAEAGYDLRALGQLAKAVPPMQEALEASIAQRNWEDAAQDAGNLSELCLTLGNLTQALTYAQQGMDLADGGGSVFQRVVTRTTLANALHQAGSPAKANAIFCEAEDLQRCKMQRPFPLLYSLRGYLYCDLLLSQGKYQEVQNRASRTLKWMMQIGRPLDVALDHLSLGRAYLLQAQREGTEDASAALRASLTQAATHLNQAVDGLRQAGHQEFIARGLLARAALHRAQDQFAWAQRDLGEALPIATRGGMRLHEADCHLESARLHLAQGEKKQARESLSRARRMVEEMGYHRRDGEVAAVEEMLEAEAPR